MESKFLTGKLSSFLVQSQSAANQAVAQWQKHLDDGYVEIAPGVLRHPVTGTEIHNG